MCSSESQLANFRNWVYFIKLSHFIAQRLAAEGLAPVLLVELLHDDHRPTGIPPTSTRVKALQRDRPVPERKA